MNRVSRVAITTRRGRRLRSSYLVVFTSGVVLKQRDAFTVQPPVMSFPLKHRDEEMIVKRGDGERRTEEEMRKEEVDREERSEGEQTSFLLPLHFVYILDH